MRAVSNRKQTVERLVVRKKEKYTKVIQTQ